MAQQTRKAIARDRALSRLEQTYPVLAAIWLSIEEGDVTPRALATRLGITDEKMRVMLITAEWLLGTLEAQESRALRRAG